VILIDGENFRYSLMNLFPKKFKYLPKLANWFKLLTLPLSDKQELIRIYWYVVGILHFRPFKIPDSNEELEELLKKVVFTKLELKRNLDNKDAYLNQKRDRLKKLKLLMRKRFAEWKEFQDDICHKFDFIEFRYCGSLPYNLLTVRFEREKGIDIKLATDLLEFRNMTDQTILFSGDQDYIPAIQVYKDAGKQIFSVNFETENGDILPGRSYKLEGMVDKVITLKHDQINEWIEEF